MKQAKALILLTLMGLPLMGWAKPEVKIEATAQKAVVVEENGQQVTKMVTADSVEPGQHIHFTLSYSNNGDEAAHDVVIDNPLPADTVYVAGSASGKPQFSIDQGRHFAPADELMEQTEEGERRAEESNYTHIRWTIPEIAPQQMGEVKFQVKVK